MNTLQEKIYSVIKAIVEIDDFENYYAEHAISYLKKTSNRRAYYSVNQSFGDIYLHFS
tara:strand:- start:158 stop:331 length:174 start_codon:yes stop_codon:yes gene_type:complete